MQTNSNQDRRLSVNFEEMLLVVGCCLLALFLMLNVRDNEDDASAGRPHLALIEVRASGTCLTPQYSQLPAKGVGPWKPTRPDRF